MFVGMAKEAKRRSATEEEAISPGKRGREQFTHGKEAISHTRGKQMGDCRHRQFAPEPKGSFVHSCAHSCAQLCTSIMKHCAIVCRVVHICVRTYAQLCTFVYTCAQNVPHLCIFVHYCALVCTFVHKHWCMIDSFLHSCAQSCAQLCATFSKWALLCTFVHRKVKYLHDTDVVLACLCIFVHTVVHKCAQVWGRGEAGCLHHYTVRHKIVHTSAQQFWISGKCAVIHKGCTFLQRHGGGRAG